MTQHVSSYLTEEENQAALVQQVDQRDQEAFSMMKASRIEAAFSGRFLIVFKPTGLNADKTHRAPEILTALNFSDFFADGHDGADFVVRDTRMGESMTIGHVPTRAFDYDLFLQMPPVFRLRWDARRGAKGLDRSLVFPVNVFTRNRSNYYSAGVTYAETPNRFRDMFPGVTPDLNFK